MKINNVLISSLDSLRINFDFIEIWNKRDIAIRDLSPCFINYCSEDLISCYGALSNPDKVKSEDGKLILQTDAGNIILPFEITSNLLNNFTQSEKIQIAALYYLADRELSKEILDVCLNEISLSEDRVILKNGNSLLCGQHVDGMLTHKAIIVEPTSKKPSTVGNYILQPGQATYGVFCKHTLIAVVPPYNHNSSFYAEYEIFGDDIILVVTDVATNTQVAKFANGHYYSMLGDNDFVVINGLIVSCFNNEDLNNRLRQNVIKSKSPEILEVINGIIKVIYKDNTYETIQI